MTHRTTIILDDDSFAFLNSVAGDNRSACINQLLKRVCKNSLREALYKANQEEANDADYQEELKKWESMLSDDLQLMADFKQLEIYWIDLGSTKDAETKNLRPYVIIQGDFIKDALNIVFDL